MRRSSKPELPFERTVGEVRFLCSTEEKPRQQATTADAGSLRRVSTKTSLVSLLLGADRAGLFGSFDVDPETQCYLWSGRKTKQGYGVVCIDYRTITVHRAVYRILVEDIDDSLDVHHLCERPSCLNPDHLIALTPLQHRRVHAGLGFAWSKSRLASSHIFALGFIGFSGMGCVARAEAYAARHPVNATGGKAPSAAELEQVAAELARLRLASAECFDPNGVDAR